VLQGPGPDGNVNTGSDLGQLESDRGCGRNGRKEESGEEDEFNPLKFHA
jgi:hypothetical protein